MADLTCVVCGGVLITGQTVDCEDGECRHHAACPTAAVQALRERAERAEADLEAARVRLTTYDFAGREVAALRERLGEVEAALRLIGNDEADFEDRIPTPEMMRAAYAAYEQAIASAPPPVHDRQRRDHHEHALDMAVDAAFALFARAALGDKHDG